MVLLQNKPALLATSGEVRRLTLPLGSPEFPSEVIKGRFIGTGTRDCTEGKGRLAGMGVRMGMVEILGMDDRPIDRFGMDPIPIQRKHTVKHGDIMNRLSKQKLLGIISKNGSVSCYICYTGSEGETHLQYIID